MEHAAVLSLVGEGLCHAIALDQTSGATFWAS